MRIAVTGHRGLSPGIARAVGDLIRAELAGLDLSAGLTGLTCLADGADQIFASAVLELGGSLEVILPSVRYRAAVPEEAKPEYDRLLARASAIHTCDHEESTADAHMDAGRVMVDRADSLFAIWDGEPARSYGGTADVVAYAREKRVAVSVIWPAGAVRI
jgi:hypothetical protein